ncbi:hypothetical protein WG66_009679 [Moniliophthora roreri]|uniref:F-box domain-containing protein n=1 Tax=Moniliophthora roreri TaxID=221103 RepID=A0A0W0G5L5_MONRR|nr:hypothetical protein WG66_009679 [Moniliophthora roreri]
MDFSGALFLHRHYISALQGCFSSVKRLDLELRMETFNSLFLFICSLTQLEVLALSCEALRDEIDAEPRLDLTLPTSLHTLYLNIVVFHGFCGDQFWAWLRGQTPMNNLRNLSILNCDSSTGPEERVPTYIGLSNELTSLYLSIPTDDIDPLTYLGEEDASEYEYDLSSLESLETLSIHIPDSEVTASAPLPQLSVVLKRLTTTLKSISSIHLQKLNFIIGENNLHQISAAEWDDLDNMLSSERFSLTQKEIFVPIVQRSMANVKAALWRARRPFSRCEGQKRLVVTHLNRYGYSGLNLLEQNSL